jgi:glycosyltransferase involved in cell wall biosynthesis
MKEENLHNIRVMMIGPGKGIIGGINSLIDTILPSIQETVNLLYFPTVSNRPIKKSGQLSLLNITIAISQFFRFFRASRKFHPQILHVHTSEGIAWLKDTLYIWFGIVLKCKIIIHFHAANFDELYTRHSLIIRTYTRYMLSKVDTVITVSETWKKKLSSIVQIEKIHSLKNCVHLVKYPSLKTQNGNVTYGLFLGCIGSRKGAFDIIEAVNIAKLDGRKLHVWLAGYEDHKGDMKLAEHRILELKIEDRCELIGVIKGENKSRYLKEMDFLILPSYNEGLPMAILEAMAEGRAIISSPVGGIPEIVRDGYNGFLVNPGDIRNLSEKMAILTESDELCKKMGLNSLIIVKKELSVEVYVQELSKLYKDLIQSYA